MIKCLLVDDEPLALAQLENYVKRIPFLECVGCCSNAAEAMSCLGNGNVDAMFLDINMPDITGLQLVKGLSNPPKVVFTTAYSEYALDGFKVDAVDYLLKPFGFDEFLHAANKVNELCSLGQAAKGCDTPVVDAICDDCIFVKSDYRVVRIPLQSIRYVEGMSEYVRIFVDGETKPVVSLLSMRKVEEELCKGNFMRVHRSYVVNLSKIKEVSKMRIIYDGDVALPIGDIYKDKFFEYIDRHYLGR